jgi:hypothetical protein
MHVLAAVLGFTLLFAILWDAFETIVLPRRVTRRYRLARAFYQATWSPWRTIAMQLSEKRRERMLSFFGPLSLLALIVTWALAILLSFGFLHFGLRSRLEGDAHLDLFTCLYFSGTNLFTLGLGDIRPIGTAARILAITEAGTGFGFLALVIGYFPVLYQSFSRREVQISLLDARAGSPPTAMELCQRNLRFGPNRLREQLASWELWCAELMESHLSYPVLSYFRSQHDNTSWLAGLTAVLDVATLVIAHTEGESRHQAEMTFAIARHAIVDLSQTFSQPPVYAKADRMKPELLREVKRLFSESGFHTHDDEAFAAQRVRELRGMYEPYIDSLGAFLLMRIPPFQREHRPDNWQTSAWGKITAGLDTTGIAHDDHL